MLTIHNKNGHLSKYGLSCGYVDTCKKEGVRIELYKEGNIYHVRKSKDNNRLSWDSFHNLIEARNKFNALVKQLYD